MDGDDGGQQEEDAWEGRGPGEKAVKGLRRKGTQHTQGSEALKVRGAFVCQVVTVKEELGAS